MSEPTAMIPLGIRPFAQRLERATGTAPTVARLDPATWLLTHENTRVRLTVTYRRGPSGRMVWKTSDLHIDGRLVDNSRDFDHYVEIYRDPAAHTAEPPAAAPLDPITPLDDDADIPAFVAAGLRDARRAGAGHDIRAALGHGPDGSFVLEITTPKATVHVDYRRAQGAWGMADIRAVTADGRDLSPDINGDIAAALAAILGTGDTPDPAPVIGQRAPGARSNSVEVRRQTVIRT